MSPEAPMRGGRGVFVAVVGPSGAGKDTLIARAAERLGDDPRFVFARRVVTRTAEKGAEDHASLDPETFAAWEAEGRFCLAWRAHGLAYGLSADLETTVAQGSCVVANLSRRAIASLIERMDRVAVVTVTAPAETLVARIVARGREDRDAARERVARQVPEGLPACSAGTFTIDNSSRIEDAVDRFCDILREVGA